MITEKMICPYCDRLVKVRIVGKKKTGNVISCKICRKEWTESKL